LGLKIKNRFILGVMSDYHVITQLSALDASVGNRRGTYFNMVSPMLGLDLGKAMVRGTLLMMGQYDMQNLTYFNQALTYSGPMGFRAELGWRVKNRFMPYVFFEQASFSKVILDGVEGAANPGLVLQQFGAGIGIIL